jgi:hypothetical protein
MFASWQSQPQVISQYITTTVLYALSYNTEIVPTGLGYLDINEEILLF